MICRNTSLPSKGKADGSVFGAGGAADGTGGAGNSYFARKREHGCFRSESMVRWVRQIGIYGDVQIMEFCIDNGVLRDFTDEDG